MHTPETPLEQYISRGGFPPSVLSDEDSHSFEWRIDFIATFLERDLLQFAGFPPTTMQRLWQMLAHSNGQILNLSKLGDSLGVSHTTIRNYVDLLEGTFMVKQIRPWTGNTKKRLVKSPRVYLTDTGITAALLQLRSFEQIAGHPVFGSLWETLVIIHVFEHLPNAKLSFYRSSNGDEIDLLIHHESRTIAVECKASVAPILNRTFFNAIEDVKPDKVLIVAPVSKGFPIKKNINVVSLSELIESITDAG